MEYYKKDFWPIGARVDFIEAVHTGTNSTLYEIVKKQPGPYTVIRHDNFGQHCITVIDSTGSCLGKSISSYWFGRIE